MEISYLSLDEFNPEDDQEVCLEPIPPHLDEAAYRQRVVDLPLPTAAQIDDFVAFVSEAKSWYKHLPARPPGSPMFFYLDPHAGQDRLRRWGHRVLYRDRTDSTQKLHYTWMTTADYRRRFGHLAFCCLHATSIWTDEMLGDGAATLDPNFSEPLVEGEPGHLMLPPETVLNSGAVMVTRTVHPRTDARAVWRQWNREGAEPAAGDDAEDSPLSENWTAMASLCVELTRVGPVASKHGKAIESELNRLVAEQRRDDHERMAEGIRAMLGTVRRC
jgi:hypothetical protein